MTITEERRAQSERLRDLVSRVFPTTGRFAALEAVSGIKAARWKNFYYRKQEAAADMIQFWCEQYGHEAAFLIDGADKRSVDFAFAAPVPVNWKGQTVGDRLVWVISEWASGSGAQLFRYLEQRSRKTIPAEAWAPVVMRVQEPTLEMVQVVCEHRPYFTEWLVTGRLSGQPAVDPTSEESVREWQASQHDRLSSFRGRTGREDAKEEPI